ncbi:glycoside hydrolase family 38 C-terminal domain-containing protein [Planctomycetota bacterium]
MKCSSTYLKSRISNLLVTAIVAFCCTAVIAEGQVKLVSVKPSVFFVRKDNVLTQLGEAKINNLSQEEVKIVLQSQIPGGRTRETSATVSKGATTVRFPLADISKPEPVTFILKVEGKEHDRRSMTWRPQRKWHVYFIPITHHDLGYTDTIENVLNRYAGFYDDILRFCRETDDWPEEAKYRYTAEGAWAMQHFVETRDTESIEELGKYVKLNRIEIGALMGNEISALCSHEELVRLMYPSIRMARQFDGQVLTGSITDVPGLSWGLPTVMAGAGVKYFFAGLPTYFEWGRNDIHTFWDESAVLRHGRPDAFRWQGPDGKSVLVYYQSSYGFFGDVTGPHSYQYVMDRLGGELEKMQENDTPFSVMRYIHNGVDNYPPDMKISEIVREWNNKWAYPKLIVGTNTMFFKELEKQCSDIRTFRGELPHTDYVVGALSTAKETTINRLTHDALARAEKLATIASLATDLPYPAEDIRKAYDDMLLYDEHTWGKDYPAGKLQDWAWNEKSHYAYRAAGLTQQITNVSIQHLVNKIERKEDGHYIVVFNPFSFARTDIVRVPKFHGSGTEVYDLSSPSPDSEVCQYVDLAGPQSAIPYAAYRHARGQFESHELHDLVFVAKGVPPLGYKVFRIGGKASGSPSKNITVGPSTLENRFYKIKIDPKTGGISSIYDKQLKREFVDEDAPHKVNQFVMRWIQSGKIEGPTSVTFQKGSAGPVCGSLIIKAQGAGCPQITQEITLYDQIKRIDFANRILKDSTPLQEIYFAFPFKVNNPDFRFEGSNSVIKPFRDQFPGSNTNYYTVQHWADVSDGQFGITLSPVESHLLEFGGLWPNYCSQAHHGIDPPGYGADFVTPDQITKGHMYAFVMSSNFRTNFQPVQQSEILFRYSLTTHEGDWQKGNCARFGWAAANQFIVDDVHGKKDGPLAPDTMSFCSVDKPNVLLITLKKAEDGDGIIIRLIETQGEPTTALVTLPHISVTEATVTNLVEENKARTAFTEHEVRVDLKAFGITTIRIETD